MKATSNIFGRKSGHNLASSSPDGEKLKYPKHVFLIIGNEFCERFSYYGMRAVLVFYLNNELKFTEKQATTTFHVFAALVYSMPILGAIIADSFFGKFRTILYISILYSAGHVILSGADLGFLNLTRMMTIIVSLLGLFVIAVGTGGIKPCVSAFGADQFIVPQQQDLILKYFSMFYFSINFGALISTLLTPILRNTSCWGMKECYILAFGTPGVMMILATIIFAVGKPFYQIIRPVRNTIIEVSKCIGNAIKVKRKSKEKKEHWLDHAEEKYGKELTSEIKSTIRVLILYIPLPLFWSLYDQQGSTWTFQARQLNGDIGFYNVLPDQLQAVNCVLILVLIPIYDYAIYPVFSKIKLLRKPLQRMFVGGILLAIAYIFAAFLFIAIEKEGPVAPLQGHGHLRIYNNLNCNLKINFTNSRVSLNVRPMQIHFMDLKLKNSKNYNFTTTEGCGPGSGVFKVREKEAVGYYTMDKSSDFGTFKDSSAKHDEFEALIRNIISGAPNNTKIIYEGNNKYTPINMGTGSTAVTPIKYTDTYTIRIGKFATTKKFGIGGVYAVLVNFNTVTKKYKVNVQTITEPNKLHMTLMLPQYILLSAGEVMFSITGLSFSYSQAPVSMKAVLQAIWLLTIALGNCLTSLLTGVFDPFALKSSNFFLFAGLMVIDMAIFAMLAWKYKPVQVGNAAETPAKVDPETTRKGQ